jgi:D-threo-aldose 1-dehydrogenase
MTMLRSRRLGTTGLTVTPLCVGTAELGDMVGVYGYGVPDDRAIATVRRALQGPITFLDTSNGYGNGTSERRVGAALREVGGLPDGYVLATKVDPDETGDFSGARVRASFRESVERLGIKRLQLLYLHDPERMSFEDGATPGGPVDVMRQLVTEGLVDHLGVAGGPVDLLRRYLDTVAFEVVITHNRWTLLDRSAGPLLDYCASAGIAVVNGAPFGGGILAKGPRADPRYAYRPAAPAVLDRATQIEATCRRHQVPIAAAALQFSLLEPRIASTIVGMSRPERIDQTLELATFPTPDALWEELAGLAAPEETWLR